MNRRVATKERFLLSYCSSAIDALARDRAQVLLLCLKNIALWEAEETCHPSYALAWRDLLAKPARQIRSTVLARNDRAAALRANNPFAGVLPPGETRALREAAQSCVEINSST